MERSCELLILRIHKSTKLCSTQLALLHPQLLRSLVLIEPVLQSANGGIAPAILSTTRKDVWPSREAAAEKFRKNKFYQAWDPRVFGRWIQHGLRELPTPLFPEASGAEAAKDKRVTLATTKHQELFMYVRPTYRGEQGVLPQDDKKNYADFDPSVPEEYAEYPFYRAEPVHVLKRLPELRPSVQYMFGEKSDFSPPEGRAEKLALTGTGVGGSGGTALGKVEQILISKSSHFVVMEKPRECAHHITNFLGRELNRWRGEAEQFKRRWTQRAHIDKVTIDEKWVKEINPKT